MTLYLLKLKNFRIYKNKIFIFDKDFMLISGKSGAGKSTIFMAIHFALTGKGKKICSYGEKICSVELKIDERSSTTKGACERSSTTEGGCNFLIKRSKNPNRLLCYNEKNEETEDEEAQEIINQKFYKYHLGYFEQKNYKSFLNIPPKEKIYFLNNFLNQEIIQEVKRKNHDLLKKYTENFQQLSNEINFVECFLKDLKNSFFSEPNEIVVDQDENNIKKKIENINETITCKKNLSIEISELKNTNLQELKKNNLKLQEQKILWEKYSSEKKKLKQLCETLNCEKLSNEEIENFIKHSEYLMKFKKQKIKCPKCFYCFTINDEKIDEIKLENYKQYFHQSQKCKVLKITKPNLENLTNDLKLEKEVSIFNKIFSEYQDDSLETLKDKLNTLQNKLSFLLNNNQKKIFLNYQEKLSNLQEKIKEAEKLFLRTQKMEELIKKAEKISLLNIIHQINLILKKFVQVCFDGFFNVKIILEKDEIKLEIKKEDILISLENLSGGEFDRLQLCFMITTCQIFNIKLLLLDECLSSLDQETTEKILIFIRENFNGKVLCIAHQIVQGYFNDVIDLE
jgi:exonuclease SbcC